MLGMRVMEPPQVAHVEECLHLLLEAIDLLLVQTGDDQMTTALWCRSSLAGVILGGTHVIEGPEDEFFGGAVCHAQYAILS